MAQFMISVENKRSIARFRAIEASGSGVVKEVKPGSVATGDLVAIVDNKGRALRGIALVGDRVLRITSSSTVGIVAKSDILFLKNITKGLGSWKT